MHRLTPDLSVNRIGDEALFMRKMVHPVKLLTSGLSGVGELNFWP